MQKNWKTMRPETSRQLGALIVGLTGGVVWRYLDPEGFKPFAALLAYWWVIFPAALAFIVTDVMLMEWFGQRTEDGKPREYVKPLDDRLDRIEAAINRLHDYVQEIDPDLAEERLLEGEFHTDTGGMFAGMNHMEHADARRKAGKRTLRDGGIWRDPTL